MAKDQTQAAIQRVHDLFGTEWCTVLRAAGKMQGGDRLLRLVESAATRDDVGDHLAAAIYAVVFAGLEFSVTLEPSGADLEVKRNGHAALVEVKRMRPRKPDPIEEQYLEKTGFVIRNIDPSPILKTTYDAVREKLEQVGRSGGSSAVVLWCDWDKARALTVEIAVRDLLREQENGSRSSSEGLLFAVYGSRWRNSSTGRYFFCYPFPDGRREPFTGWQSDLASADLERCVDTIGKLPA